MAQVTRFLTNIACSAGGLLWSTPLPGRQQLLFNSVNCGFSSPHPVPCFFPPGRVIVTSAHRDTVGGNSFSRWSLKSNANPEPLSHYPRLHKETVLTDTPFCSHELFPHCSSLSSLAFNTGDEENMSAFPEVYVPQV